MWCTAPWLLFQLLRNFVSALERPRIVLWLSIAGIALNALLSWSLIFGHFGLPALGLIGGGLGSTLTWLADVRRADRGDVARPQVPPLPSVRPLVAVRPASGRWRWCGSAGRSALTMALEMGVFALAAYFMGWIGAPAVAAHAVALQLAALTFMVPLGLGQAATVRVGLALGRGDKRGITRAGWTAWVLGVGFMGAMALVHVGHPAPAGHAVPRPTCRPMRSSIALAVSFLRVAAAFQLVDGAQVIGAGMLRGLHDTRWPLIFALVGYWVVGLGIGAWLAFAADWQGVGIWVGLASGLAAVAVLMLARWIMRDRLGLTRLAHA